MLFRASPIWEEVAPERSGAATAKCGAQPLLRKRIVPLRGSVLAPVNRRSTIVTVASARGAVAPFGVVPTVKGVTSKAARSSPSVFTAT